MHRKQSKKCNKLGHKSAATKLQLVQSPLASAPSVYTLGRNYASSENYRNFQLNGKLYASVWPQSSDLLTPKEQEELKNQAWFQAGLPREIALEILLQTEQPVGAFIVRQSESTSNCFALSMRVPSTAKDPKLSHYLIQRTPTGSYLLRGLPKEFSTLKSLVVHHSVLKETLPVPLLLPRAQDIPIQNLIMEKEAEEAESSASDEESPATTLCFRRKSKSPA